MRRALRASLVALLLVTAAACGSGGEESGDTIKIGLLTPLTGPVAQNAEQQRNAAEMWVDQINEDGGIDGKKVELTVYDTKLDPATATQQAQRAISQDKVVALIGPYSTSEALAVADVVERSKVVNINNGAATEAITADREYVFRTSPLTGDLTTGMMQTAKALGSTKGVLLYDNGGFGLGAKDPLEAAAEAEGVELTGSIEYPLGAADVSAQITAAAQGDPEAVFIAGSAGADYGLIAKAMVEQGLDVPLIGFSPVVVPDAVRIAGEAYNELPGVYLLQCVDTQKQGYIDLLEDYNANFEEVDNLPEQVVQTISALEWLNVALAETGGEGGEVLVTALESLPEMEVPSGRDGVTQSFTADDHDGYGDDYLVPYKIEGGKPVQVDLDLG
jgi:branched-chain amino acid transport system substrate-binding protein